MTAKYGLFVTLEDLETLDSAVKKCAACHIPLRKQVEELLRQAREEEKTFPIKEVE